MLKLQGLIAATYTPMDDSGRLKLETVPAMVEHLLSDGVQGIYVCGSTGEGMSLTTEERMATAAAYTQATRKRLPVVVQVGHNSLQDAERLAAHAREIGADAISATCPSYFKIGNVAALIQSMKVVAAGAPELPFYYYHIPTLTGSAIDIVRFMQEAGDEIPNLTGLKYTDTKLHEFQACLELDSHRFDVVWGCDEMLLGALATGATAAIGSTYNIAAPLYQRLIQVFENHDLPEARRLQALSVQMIKQIGKFPFHSGMKHVLAMLGVPVGTCRLPQDGLSTTDVQSLRQSLEQIGFFTWSRPDN